MQTTLLERTVGTGSVSSSEQFSIFNVPKKSKKNLAECPDLVVLAGGEMTRTQEKICHIMDAASAAVAAAAAAASGQPGMVTNAYSFPFST